MAREGRQLQAGFTLGEIMVVVLIIGILASIALPSYAQWMAKARRPELTIAFADLWRAQKSFYTEHGRYAGTFDEIAFSMDTRLSPTVTRGNRYIFQLSQPWGPGSFYCVATGNIDGDDFPDVAVLEIGRP